MSDFFTLFFFLVSCLFLLASALQYAIRFLSGISNPEFAFWYRLANIGFPVTIVVWIIAWVSLLVEGSSADGHGGGSGMFSPASILTAIGIIALVSSWLYKDKSKSRK